MIPSLALLLTGRAWSQEPAAEEPVAPPAEPAPEEPAPVEDPLTPYRARFDVLTDRAIGTASTPTAFDWRRSPVELAGSGTFLLELNNFDSVRGGALVRIPTSGFLVEIGVNYVGVWDTPSSRALALTPYRQPGRPHRLELDLTGGLPLAEGVVTTFPRFFPAMEMVFVGYAGLRYSVYPTGFAHMTPGKVGGALFSPILTETELANLESERLTAMQIDLGRYGLVVGMGDDLYFGPGVFLSPRFLLGVPILAPATQTELLLTADLSLAIGVAL